MSGATIGLNAVGRQSPVDCDADDDGLIEIEWPEQLNAIRWDLDGDGIGTAINSYLLYLSYAPEKTIMKVIIARTAPSIQAPVGMSHSLE